MTLPLDIKDDHEVNSSMTITALYFTTVLNCVNDRWRIIRGKPAQRIRMTLRSGVLFLHLARALLIGNSRPSVHIMNGCLYAR
jgi:hypothetical protein